MKVLVACEYSGIVREAFAARGHDAWSCDLLPTDQPSEKHIRGNVLEILDDNWDLIIAHPPCTFLTVSNSKNWAKLQANGKQQAAIDFVLAIWDADCPRICIENPVPSRKANLPPYTQIVQPYQFGHDHSKKTCLWLKNLPNLTPTDIVKVTYVVTQNGHKYTRGWYETPRNSTDRSRTFLGIAKAMADQWG